MKMTLLEIVQDILSVADSDEVDDIFDTTESEQVVLIVEDSYNNLLTTIDWPHLNRILDLAGLSDTDTPTTVQMRDEVASLYSVRYNVRDTSDTKDKWRELKYKSPEDFIEFLLNRDSSDSNIEKVQVNSSSTAELPIINDKQPEWYTSFDDEHLVFDSFDSDVESTIQSSKTIAYGRIIPTFTKSNTFTPELPPHAFPLLLADAKAAAHFYLKQQQSPTDERRKLENKSRIRRTKTRLETSNEEQNARKNFGRRSRRPTNPKLGRR